MYDESNKIQNIISKYNENKSRNKIKYYYDHDKIFNTILYDSTITNTNTNTNRKKLDLYTNHLSTYFANNEKYFITKILELKEKDESLKSLLDQYYEYYQELINKIKNILNKINIGRLLLNKNSINTFNTKIIRDKLNKKKNIINKSEKTKDNLNKRGEYTVILPYTDILLLYFIELLIIIDYLTYFYE